MNIDQLRAAQAECRAELLALAADRAAHLAYITATLAADDFDAVPLPKGVTGRYADAIYDDVSWIKQGESTIPGAFYAPFPHSYRVLRFRNHQAADRHKQTMANPPGRTLEQMIALPFARKRG